MQPKRKHLVVHRKKSNHKDYSSSNPSSSISTGRSNSAGEYFGLYSLIIHSSFRCTRNYFIKIRLNPYVFNIAFQAFRFIQRIA